jgi:hypothetical protein
MKNIQVVWGCFLCKTTLLLPVHYCLWFCGELLPTNSILEFQSAPLVWR